jgi:hypothetical protein
MSRDTLKRLLAFRAVGPHHVNPPIDVNRTIAYYKRAKESMITPPPYEVAIYRVPFGSTTLDVESWLGGLVATFFERQYYLERDGVSISPRPGDIVIDAGVSDDVVRFSNWGAGARAVRDESGIEIKTITIDDFVRRYSLGRVNFIKMDIEGAESHALTGASDTIRRFRPRLAISAYHSLDNSVELASKISEIERSYRLYLAHHSMHSEETVLYGCVE